MVEDHILKFRLSLSRTQSNPFFSKAIPGNDTFPIKTFLEGCQVSMMIIYVKHLRMLNDKGPKYTCPKSSSQTKTYSKSLLRELEKLVNLVKSNDSSTRFMWFICFTPSLWANVTLSLTLKFKHNCLSWNQAVMIYRQFLFWKRKNKKWDKKTNFNGNFPFKNRAYIFPLFGSTDQNLDIKLSAI